MKILIPIAAMLLILSGCASNPTISQLRGDARTATFVQYGHVPLHYSFGVVDTSSFWANYGSGISTNLGGSLVAESAAASGQATEAARAAEVQKIMAQLYGNSQLDDEVAGQVIPALADAWNVPYQPSALHFIPAKTTFADNNALVGSVNANTDLVLVYAMTNLELTEKPSLSGALLAGITLGSNTKQVAAQPMVVLDAFRRQPDGKYKLIWNNICLGPAQQSAISYPFPEVIKSEAKAQDLWNAAVGPTEHTCTQLLAREGGTS